MTHYERDTREKGQYYQALIPCSWPLSTPACKAGSFKFELACIGEESEWKIISSKAGAGYFGESKLNLKNLSFIFNTRNC